MTMTTEQQQLVVRALREFAANRYRHSLAHGHIGSYDEGVAADDLAADLYERYVADKEECHDDEPRGSHDLSDDGDALASAGHGTDEDYGGSHGGDE